MYSMREETAAGFRYKETEQNQAKDGGRLGVNRMKGGAYDLKKKSTTTAALCLSVLFYRLIIYPYFSCRKN